MRRLGVALAVTGACVIGGLAAGHRAGAQAPTSPTALICGNASVLTGPATAPSGAVTVPAGDNSALFNENLPDNTTYWFAPGTHTLGTGEYSQIDPGNNDTFIGGPGAIVSGQFDNQGAFEGEASGVTIEYLTIEDFDPPNNQGAVNSSSAPGWTIEHDTMENNSPGTAVYLGTDNTLSSDCLTLNGQAGFGTYTTLDTSALTGGASNITVTGNEISYNDTCNWEDAVPDPVPSNEIQANCAHQGQNSDCGCSDGGKFWQVDGATVTDNYVHNNYDVGIWADTDNTGFNVSGNTFTDNWSVGYQEEISYNFSITDNTFTDNAWGTGAGNAGFPEGAIYVSESGGDSRVPGPYSGTALISGNTFTDNWSGVVLWQSPGRFCSDGFDGVCTLVNPSVFTQTSCGAHLGTATPSGNPDYFDGCLWKTQNVSVSDNVFNLTQADIPGCELSTNSCGQNALFSQYGTIAPYQAYVVPENISNNQDNIFSDNAYNGPWSFLGFSQGDNVTWAQWTAGFDDGSGSNDHFNGQDAGSTINGTTQPVTTTTAGPTTTTSQDSTTTTQDSTTTTTSAPPSTSTTTTTQDSTTTTTTDSAVDEHNDHYDDHRSAVDEHNDHYDDHPGSYRSHLRPDRHWSRDCNPRRGLCGDRFHGDCLVHREHDVAERRLHAQRVSGESPLPHDDRGCAHCVRRQRCMVRDRRSRQNVYNNLSRLAHGLCSLQRVGQLDVRPTRGQSERGPGLLARRASL